MLRRHVRVWPWTRTDISWRELYHSPIYSCPPGCSSFTALLLLIYRLFDPKLLGLLVIILFYTSRCNFLVLHREGHPYITVVLVFPGSVCLFGDLPDDCSVFALADYACPSRRALLLTCTQLITSCSGSEVLQKARQWLQDQGGAYCKCKEEGALAGLLRQQWEPEANA